MDDAVDMYWTDGGDGEAEVTLKGASKAKVVFSAEIEDEDDNDAGTVSGSFTATHCPVTIETDYWFYMYF